MMVNKIINHPQYQKSVVQTLQIGGLWHWVGTASYHYFYWLSLIKSCWLNPQFSGLVTHYIPGRPGLSRSWSRRFPHPLTRRASKAQEASVEQFISHRLRTYFLGRQELGDFLYQQRRCWKIDTMRMERNGSCSNLKGFPTWSLVPVDIQGTNMDKKRCPLTWLCLILDIHPYTS